MKASNIVGVIIIVLILGGIFAGLYFAYGVVGRAFEQAELKEDIVPCSDNAPCAKGTCVEGYCRDVGK